MTLAELPVNAEKCFGIQLSRSRLCSDSCDIARFDYLIGGRVLLSRSCVEDLGVNYDCNLHFDKHIDSIVSAARAKVGLLFRGFKTRDVVILRRAYVTYIRPTLEYASSVWNPYAKKSIYKLEGVQRYFTKRIPQLASLPYFERLAFLNLDTLERRRLKTDLVSYFKITKGISVFPRDYLDICYSVDFTRSKPVYLRKSIAGTQACYYSFFNRAVDCWNCLPALLLECDSLHSFKSQLDKIDLSAYCNVLD